MTALGQSRRLRCRPTTADLPPEADIVMAGRHVSKVPPRADIRRASNPPRHYGVFFEVSADLAWVARSISGGGCCSPAIAHQTLT